MDMETAAFSVSTPSEGLQTLRYSTDLFDAFPDVCQKAKHGVQSCHAIAAFVQERAVMEATYARTMLRIAQGAKAEDWAPGLAKCWSLVQETLEGIAKEHADAASKMQLTMVAGVKAFAAQQEVQVQRLMAEGTKFRVAFQNMKSTMDRAKEKYERKRSEALELTMAMRRDTMETSPSSVNGTSPSGEEPKDTTEKNSGAGQLLTMMTSFSKPSVERQRLKLDACLEELIAAEKHYLQSVEYVNAQRAVIERETTENLHAFQLTEEQRIDYLKDVLLRMQKAFQKALQGSQALIDHLKDSTSIIDEFVDIEQGFRRLSSDVDPDAMIKDSDDNPFYSRMLQVQSMSDRGHQIVKTIHSTISDLMTVEDQFILSVQKLLRAHDATYSSNGDLFNLTPSLSHVVGEGSSMHAGWQSSKDQLHRMAEIHQEFRSLLSEPVSLSLSTMKQEYETVRGANQENFSKSHAALALDVAQHRKLQQKLAAKSRDFVQVFSSLPDLGGSELSDPIAVDQVLILVQHMSGSFSDKDKRTEVKLKQLAEELKEAQAKFAECKATLKNRSSAYVQDIDVFISVYMKNEKYRLQVEKSSLQSLAKALEHMLSRQVEATEKTFHDLNAIDSTKDVAEFIQEHRKPHEKCKKIVPVLSVDKALKEALEEYQLRASAPTSVSSERSPPKQDSDHQLSSLKRAKSVLSTLSNDDQQTNNEEMDKDMTDFQKKFKLDSPEQVVESYSCALFLNNFPNHGRMYLTRERLCFTGWRDTIYVLSYTDIVAMEKKNTALIVPNAIEITAQNGEKTFFTSFVFRDECYQCILQLQAIQEATAAAMADTKLTVETESTHLEEPEVASPSGEAPVTPAATRSEQPTQQAVAVADRPVPSTKPNGGTKRAAPAPVRRIPERDTYLDEYEIVLNERLPFSVDFAYKSLWIESDEFFHEFLTTGGETNIQISKWDMNPLSYTAVDKTDNFLGSRRVAYNHNKKYMVGPSCIPTVQTQRFKWDPSSQLIISSTSTVSDAPYCDYFRAENRWVFSANEEDDSCTLQVGIRIQWVKSTWLKKQIESTAMTEAKEYTKSLVSAAIEESKNAGFDEDEDPETDFECEESNNTHMEAVGDDMEVIMPPRKKSKSNADAKTPRRRSSAARPVHRRASATIAPPTTAPTTTIVPSLLSRITSAQPEEIQSYLQVANILCILFFMYMMYRLVGSMQELQSLTKASLIQQQQQQELLREMLLLLQQRGASP
ncbi:hypothetical protein Poli38472_013862 [Pythium oligandrum]|uniref:VASt domain-containing protein n=1 Tax=Pythium oligandrum TaxID=41045 RepID=A0A8K1C288_PYTOL|nr:hypothetical protein Poli38472_013862 [Pythium oligandrum]|eukprot:TMW55100.1 hypothetical protein Poli38472_013862 [Pythium oligandrum]